MRPRSYIGLLITAQIYRAPRRTEIYIVNAVFEDSTRKKKKKRARFGGDVRWNADALCTK